MTARRKIIFCYYSANNISGPGSWLPRIINNLRSFEIVALSVKTTEEHCTVSKYLAENSIRTHVVDQCSSNIFSTIQEIIEIIRFEKPDVVVADYILPALFVNYWTNSAGIKMIQIIRSDDEWHWRMADEFIFGPYSCRIHGVVTVSLEIYNSVRPRLPSDIRLMYCPSSVDLAPNSASWNHNNFHAVYFGRFEEKQKRIIELTQQLISVSKSRPWFSATLYGDGPEKDNVIRILRNSKGHRISYGGIINHSNVYSYLRKAQAFILLSAYEGLSTAMQEAMMCGVPVITRRVNSGVDSIIMNNSTGLIIDEDDQLGPAIDELFYDVEKWTQISEQAYHLAIKEFSIKNAALKWQTLLTSIIKPAPQRQVILPSIKDIEDHFRFHMLWGKKMVYDRLIWYTRYASPQIKSWTDYIRSIFLDRQYTFEVRRMLLYHIHDNKLVSNRDLENLASELLNSRIESDSLPAISLDQYNLASLHELAGNFDEANRLFHLVLESETMHNYHHGCCYHLGMIAVKQDQLKNAKMYLEKCLQLCPEHKAADSQLRSVQTQLQ